MTETTKGRLEEGQVPEFDVESLASGEGAELEVTMFGRKASLWSDAWRQCRRRPLFWVCATIICVLVVAAMFPSWFTSADPRACSLTQSLLRPSGDHWFGTDLQGCDYFARVVYGTRVSITVGSLVTLGAAVVALIGGSIAGFYGGVIDTLIARLTDVWFSIPGILGSIVLLTLFSERTIFTVSLAIIVFGWPTMLRLVRSSVLSVKETDYVDAARALGASDFRIITRHILPNAITPLIVYSTITVGVVIAAEATLSYLGVGLRLPSISWGLMISDADDRIFIAPHLLLFPGAVLSVTVFAFILLGDVLRDALDPKLR
jgi:ABC-type dipeptide/oligopeptide/nickel transport system permease subunit